MRELQWTSRAHSIARSHMRTHGAANGIDVGQRDARMPHVHSLLDEFLGVACAGEEGMIALDEQFAPLDIPGPACARERRGRSVRRIIASVSAAAPHWMEHMFWWRLIGHRLSLSVVVLNAIAGGSKP